MIELGRVTLDIPEKISTNKIYAGVFWKKRHELGELYHSYVLCNKNLFKAIKIAYPLHIGYHFTFKSRSLDASNCSYMVKLFEDGLVRSGIILGDEPKYVSHITMSSCKGTKDQCEIVFYC